jgi:hypothetical protein
LVRVNCVLTVEGCRMRIRRAAKTHTFQLHRVEPEALADFLVLIRLAPQAQRENCVLPLASLDRAMSPTVR